MPTNNANMPRVPVCADTKRLSSFGFCSLDWLGLSGEESKTQRDVSGPQQLLQPFHGLLFSRIMSFGFVYTDGTVESGRYAVLFVNSVVPPPSRVRDARRALLAL